MPPRPTDSHACRQVLLGVLPLETAQWKETLERNRSLYDTYVEELMEGPARARAESEVDDVSVLAAARTGLFLMHDVCFCPCRASP